MIRRLLADPTVPLGQHDPARRIAVLDGSIRGDANHRERIFLRKFRDIGDLFFHPFSVRGIECNAAETNRLSASVAGLKFHLPFEHDPSDGPIRPEEAMLKFYSPAAFRIKRLPEHLCGHFGILRVTGRQHCTRLRYRPVIRYPHDPSHFR